MADSKPTVIVPYDAWTRIVMAALESDDWKLRTLIEQAVPDVRLTAVDPFSSSAGSGMT